MSHYAEQYAADEHRALHRAYGPIPLIDQLREEERPLTHNELLFLEKRLLEGKRDAEKLRTVTNAVAALRSL